MKSGSSNSPISTVSSSSKGNGNHLSKEAQITARIASLKNELNDAAVGDAGCGGAGNKSTGGNAQTSVLIEQLQDDLKRRQESYVRRERGYEEMIRELENDISRLTAGRTDWMEQDEKMCNIREMHKQLMRNVGTVQENTAKVLEDQERDLLRAFRARLFDIQNELEIEKSKADVGASAWIERNRQLERGLDWAKGMADRLERVNQNLQAENSKLKAQYKTQENDREFLIKQLVVVKKDNVQLRQEIETRDKTIARLTEENEALALFKKQHINRAGSNMGGSEWVSGMPKAALGLGLQPSHGSGSAPGATSTDAFAIATSQEPDERYKEIIKRLKKLLNTERNSLRKVRAAYNTDLKNRTELEVLLRESVTDVRKNIIAARKKGYNNRLSSSNNGSMSNSRSQNSLPVRGSGLHAATNLRCSSSSASLAVEDSSFLDANDFEARDREKVLELLLSQERVVSILYRKTFPTSKAVPSNFVVDVDAEDIIQQDMEEKTLTVNNPEQEAIVKNRQDKIKTQK